MREIKFRAWDVYKKKFIPSDVWAICNEPTNRAQAVMIADWEDYRVGESFYPEHQVLSLYTGFNDTDGTNVYEGDILQTNIEGNILLVEWSDYFGSFTFNGLRATRQELEDLEVKIIGNIHENAELLSNLNK